jgi:NADH:ubiquinone oxidoreductase subunit 6 (subunit J)
MTVDILELLLREHWVQLLTGVFMPLAVGWATKLHAHPAVKSAVNFLLSLLAGALEAITLNGNVVDIEQIVSYVLAIYVTSHLSLKMVWRPAAGGEADPVSLATPNVGVGTPIRASGGRSS